MAKPTRSSEQPTTPKEFAETTPIQSAGDGADWRWLMTAMNKNTEALGELKGTIGGLRTQLGALESKVDKIHEDTSKHGKWIAVASAMTLLAVAAFGWLATVLGEVLKQIISAKVSGHP